MDESTIIYDDEQIRVIWSPGAHDMIVVSFGDLISPAFEKNFFAEKPLRKLSIPAIGIMSKSPNWYPKENIVLANDRISELIKRYRLRITYGGSMGGYAAIKYSRLFSATQVIALCPQWSLDIEECSGVNPGWQQYFRPSMKRMGVRKEDVSGDMFLFVDPFDRRDMMHLLNIKENSFGATHIKVPFVGHHVTSAFAGTSNLNGIIDACISNDLVRLHKISRETRRSYPYYLEKADEIIEKKFIGRLIESAISQPDFLRRKRHLFPLLLDYLKIKKGIESASEFFEKSFLTLGLAHKEAFLLCLWAADLLGKKVSIRTHHGTILCYDVSKNSVGQAVFNRRSWEVPIAIKASGQLAYLYVMLGNYKIYVKDVDGDHLAVCDDSNPEQKCFELIFSDNGSFFVRHGEEYLCAEPGGKVAFNRRNASAWEKFYLKLTNDPDEMASKV